MHVPESGLHMRDVFAHYGFTTAQDASGQRIGLVHSRGSVVEGALESFCALEGLPAPRVTRPLPVDSPESQDAVLLMVTLQLLSAAAPGAEIVLCQSDGTEMGIFEAFSRAIFTDGDPVSVICSTEFVSERALSDEFVMAAEQRFQESQAFGIPIVAPAFALPDPTDTVWPAASPFVLACAPVPAAGSVPAPAGTVTSSGRFPVPKWQRKSVSNQASGRVLPDVCAAAGDGAPYRVRLQRWVPVRGVHVAALIWAGVTARLVQAGGRPVTWPDEVYARLGPAGASTPAGPPPRKPSWQPGVGWGVPNGERMLAALTR